MGLGLDEVEAPNVVSMLGTQPDARSVGQPEPTSLGLLLRDLQPLATPDALNPILANLDPALVEQRRHPAIAVTAILRSEFDDVVGQLIFLGLLRGDVSLRPSRLPDDPAGLSLAQPVPVPSRLNCLPASLGAYNFPWAISRSTCFSNDRSATSFFSRPFSSSSCFSRLA